MSGADKRRTGIASQLVLHRSAGGTLAPPPLTRAAWAWEFLRRNPQFARALETARVTFQEEDPIGQFRVFTATTLTGIGGSACIYASSAAHDARGADVLWHPEAYAGVLTAFAIGAPIKGRPALRLADLPFGGVLLRCGAVQHLLVRQERVALQLCVSGTDLRRPVHVFPQPRTASLRGAALQAWATFLELERCASLRPLPPLQAQPATRLSQVLTALDGWRAGVPHRQIAIALFGTARVAREWRDPHECLRDSVRRAIARGRQLSEAGYRRMLSAQRL